MRFTDEELSTIVWLVKKEFVKTFKQNAMNGKSNDNDFVRKLNEISKKACDELTRRMG